MWIETNRADDCSRRIADRHYNRQKIGATQFVPPGRCVVLLTDTQDALWVTSWPFAKYVKHAWAGAWVNSLFRNEGDDRASDLIRAALIRTMAVGVREGTRGVMSDWSKPPALGCISFVDSAHVEPKKMRTHRCAVNCGSRNVVGFCYERAGFTHVGYTKAGLWTWQILPEVLNRMVAP